MKFHGHLVSIKKVIRNSTVKNKKHYSPFKTEDMGTNKRTDIMIRCNDGLARRVRFNSNIFEYVLFVVVRGERLILSKNQFTPCTYFNLEDIENC